MLHGFEGTVKVGGRPVKNLRFVDNIDLLGRTRSELSDLSQRLDTTSRKYGIEVSGGKRYAMLTASSNNGRAHNEMLMNRDALEEVTSYKYLR